jgi:hypothetical protein
MRHPDGTVYPGVHHGAMYDALRQEGIIKGRVKFVNGDEKGWMSGHISNGEVIVHEP